MPPKRPRVSFSEPDQPSRTPSPVIINLGEIHMRTSINRPERRMRGTKVSRIARSSQDPLTEMTATLAIQERALELTEERYAAAVRKKQELEKEIMQLKATQRRPAGGLRPTVEAQLERPPRPMVSSSPISPSPISPPAYSPITHIPASFNLVTWPATWPTSSSQYGTIYVDVDFMVDATGRVTPLHVRPRL